MRQLISGNDDALAVIVDRYQGLIFSVAWHFLKNEEEADDVVKVVFLDVFRKKEILDPSRKTLKLWLLQAAYTRSINRRYHLRQGNPYSKLDTDEIDPLAFATVSSVDSWIPEVDFRMLVSEAIACLNAEHRQAVKLVFIQGLTIEEAAEKSGNSLAAIRHNYARGMINLRKILLARAQPEREASGIPLKEGRNLEMPRLKARPT